MAAVICTSAPENRGPHQATGGISLRAELLALRAATFLDSTATLLREVRLISDVQSCAPVVDSSSPLTADEQ
jgi:hypothetical protein